MLLTTAIALCSPRSRDKKLAPRLRTFFLVIAALLIVAGRQIYAQGAGAQLNLQDFNAATSTGVQTNGKAIGPGLYFGQLATEAEGRQAVILVGQGQYVQFTLTSPANGVVVHYAMPDAKQGGGLSGHLNLYVNGALTTSLALTSAYNWLYGAYPYQKTPVTPASQAQAPHNFYNDARYLFSSTLAAGTVVKLQVAAGDSVPWYIVNTADFETVPAAIAPPANSIDVTQAPYSADNTGSTDVTATMQKAINAGSSAGQTVYVPKGSYKISSTLSLSNVTLQGAGEWYTEFHGDNVGFTGNQNPASTNVQVSDLALFSDATTRNTGGRINTGFNGGFSNSSFSNIWMQNEKSGIYVIGPTTGLKMNGLRMLDLEADGLNFYAYDGAITNSAVTNSYVRNSQDDGIALWAANGEDSTITVDHNTVISPGLANNVAVYGSGNGTVISNNLLMDPVHAGSCFQEGQRFSAVPADGTLTVENNSFQGCGVFDADSLNDLGALLFVADQGNIAATENVTGNTIANSPYSAYWFTGPNSTTGVNISKDTLSSVGTYVLNIQGPGSASITDITASGVTLGGYENCNSNFSLSAASNTGWSPSPASCSPPQTRPLWVFPDVATFQTTQGTTVTQTIAIANASYTNTTLGSLSVSSGFTLSTDPNYPCTSTLQAAQSTTFPNSGSTGFCLVDVVFNAATAGVTTGTLTIPSSAPGGTTTVMLIGSTGSNTVAQTLAVSPSSVSFGNVPASTASSVQTVQISNPSGAPSASISIAVSQGFTQTNNCPSSLAGGSACQISVTFHPTAAGSVSGTLSITSSAGSPITVALSGNGTSAPTAPTAIAASPQGGSTIGVSWTGSTGSTPITYNVYRGTTSGGEGTTPIATGVTAITYADTGLTPGQIYFYEVSASNSVGQSSRSAETSATAESTVVQIDAGGTGVSPYAADEYFSTGSEFASDATVSTSNVVNSAPMAVYQSVRYASSFNYTIPGLKAGATYTVRLHFAELTFNGAGQRQFNVAINGTSVLTNFDIYAAAGGQNVAVAEEFNTTASSGGTVVISFTQGIADNPEIAGIEILSPGSSAVIAPSAPSGLTAKAGNASVALSWAASTGSSPLTYTVYRAAGTSGTNATSIASNLSTISYTDSSVANGTTYTYYVTATNKAGSATSSQVTATPQATATAPSAPTGVSATAGNQSVALSWTSSTGAAPISYNVYRGTTTGGESTTALASGLSSTTYSDTGLTNGQKYYYIVKATNAAGTSVASAEASATPQSTTGALLQIDAGGQAVAPFSADTDFNNGSEATTTASITTSGVTNAAPSAVYQSVRYAPSFTYVLPGFTPGSSYTLRLHFVELTFNGAGQRVFNVAVNGTSFLKNFDVYATAGAQNKAVVEQTTATADALGQITVSFTQSSADNPDMAGLEVLGTGSVGRTPQDVVAINTGSTVVSSPFVADTDYSGGSTFSSSATIQTGNTSTPAPAAAYQSCRYGSFTYTVPNLTAGKSYAVRLHFAELTFSGSGQRAFNVSLNGTAVLSNFDIYATSGASDRAITQQFNAIANSSGQIVIAFTPGSADNPEINGIEVLQ